MKIFIYCLLLILNISSSSAASDFIEMENSVFYAQTDTLSASTYTRYYRDETTKIHLFTRIPSMRNVNLSTVPILGIYFTAIDVEDNRPARSRAQNWIDSGALKILKIRSSNE